MEMQISFFLSSSIDCATIVGYIVVSRPFLDLLHPRHLTRSADVGIIKRLHLALLHFLSQNTYFLSLSLSFQTFSHFVKYAW